MPRTGLHPDADPDDLESKLPQFMEKQMGPAVAESNDYHLQLLEEIHLYSGRDYNLGGSGISELYLLSTLALFILLIACINYTNLATALFSSRAREVGLRKVVGAGSGQVARQFLVESATVSLISLALAVWIVEFVVGFFLDDQFAGGTYSGELRAFKVPN